MVKDGKLNKPYISRDPSAGTSAGDASVVSLSPFEILYYFY